MLLVVMWHQLVVRVTRERGIGVIGKHIGVELVLALVKENRLLVLLLGEVQLGEEEDGVEVEDVTR